MFGSRFGHLVLHCNSRFGVIHGHDLIFQSNILFFTFQMKHIKIILFAAAVVFLSGAASASTTWGTIKRVVCHADGVSPICQVSLNEPFQNACGSPIKEWSFHFNGTTAQGKNLLAIVLAAQSARQLVMVGGTGVCTFGTGGSEEMRHIFIDTSAS
jgi:hypothetical protein